MPLPPASPSTGKSSLIGALFRLTEIESGLITIDGVNTKALALRQLRASMALIPQVWPARSCMVLSHSICFIQLQQHTTCTILVDDRNIITQ
jgi:ABC-type cobalamin/Fe3+-siderophores transport system ATPase subunit